MAGLRNVSHTKEVIMRKRQLNLFGNPLKNQKGTLDKKRIRSAIQRELNKRRNS